MRRRGKQKGDVRNDVRFGVNTARRRDSRLRRAHARGNSQPSEFAVECCGELSEHLVVHHGSPVTNTTAPNEMQFFRVTAPHDERVDFVLVPAHELERASFGDSGPVRLGYVEVTKVRDAARSGGQVREELVVRHVQHVDVMGVLQPSSEVIEP